MIKLTIQNLYFKKAENQLLKMEGTPMVEMEGACNVSGMHAWTRGKK